MGKRLRSVALGLVMWLGFVAPEDTSARAAATPPLAACTPASACCSVCEKGYACGNSCISRAKQCHKGRGCACNASEVCVEEPSQSE